VVGGKLYLGGADGKFHCLQVMSGEEVWSYNAKSIDFSPAAVSADRVVFITAADRVVSLDRDSGQWVWEYQYLRSEDLAVRGICPPKIDETTVYVGLGGGVVAALDLGTGKLLWKQNAFTGEQFLDVDAPLLVDESSVYAVSVSGQLAALSKKTGKVYWKYEEGGPAGCTMDEASIYLASDGGEIIAIDKITGKKKWSIATVSKAKVNDFVAQPTRPALVGGHLIAISRSGRVIVLDKDTGELAAARNFHADLSSPVTKVGSDGFLFIDNRGVVRLWPNGPFGGK